MKQREHAVMGFMRALKFGAGAVLISCSAIMPPTQLPPATNTAVATPSPFPSPRLSTFQTQHTFWEFIYRNGKLIFTSGEGQYPPYANEIVQRDLQTGAEDVIATVTNPKGSAIEINKSDDWLLFLEAYNEGPLIYRLRAIGRGQDLIIAELSLPNADDQLRQRQQFLPMIALDASLAVWTEALGPVGSPTVLRAMDLASGRRADLYMSQQALTFPAVSEGEVIFGEGADAERRLMAVRAFANAAPTLVSPELDLSQPAYHEGLIVAKKGGGNAIDPHGIVWVDRATGKTTEIMPEDEGSWSPSFNERFVVWQGGRTQQGTVRTYDRTTNTVVDIYSVTKTPKPPIASRPTAFPGALVWLSVRPEDATGPADSYASAIPQFNVLQLR